MPLFMALLAIFATLSAHPGTYLATGAKGTQVVALQTALHSEGSPLAEDGIFGPRTATAVRAFQQHHGLAADGRVGLSTAEALVSAFLPASVLRQGASGPGVDEVQSLLVMDGANIAVDGNFGPQTESAVKRFQKEHELTADGIVGRHTWAALADPEVTVKKGDTLASLTAPYGIPPLAVARADGIDANLIYPGEVLWIPVFGPAGAVAPTNSGGGAGSTSGSAGSGSPSTSTTSPSTTSSAPPKRSLAWGGAATPSLAIAFYGPPDPVLLAGVAGLGIPVTVFVSATPTSAVPSGITVGVDALAGSGWRQVAKVLKGSSSTPVMALAGAGTASGPSLWADGLLPVVGGKIATASDEQALVKEIVDGAAGGELEAIPLSASGIRAAWAALSELRSEGYVLKSAAALYGL